MGFDDMFKPKTTTSIKVEKPKKKAEPKPKPKKPKKPKLKCDYCGQARWTKKDSLDSHKENCPDNPKNQRPAFDTTKFDLVKDDVTLLKDKISDFEGKLNAVQNNVSIIQDNTPINKLVDLVINKMDREAELEKRLEVLENDKPTTMTGSNGHLIDNLDKYLNSLTIDKIITVVMDKFDLKKFDKSYNENGKIVNFFANMKKVRNEPEILNDNDKLKASRLIHRIVRGGDRVLYNVAIEIIKAEISEILKNK